MSRAEAVRISPVSLGSIKRWMRLRQTHGDLSPQRPGGRATTMTVEQEAPLQLQVQMAPDATLTAHAEQWNADHGTTVSRWTVARAMRRLTLSRKKKTLIASERDPWERARFTLTQGHP